MGEAMTAPNKHQGGPVPDLETEMKAFVAANRRFNHELPKPPDRTANMVIDFLILVALLVAMYFLGAATTRDFMATVALWYWTFVRNGGTR